MQYIIEFSMAFRPHLIALAAVAAGVGALFQPLEAKAASPSRIVIVSTAVNYCMYDYGYMDQEDSYNAMVAFAESQGIAPYQVNNIVSRPSFSESVIDVIDDMGGCGEIIARLKSRVSRSASGLTGDSGNDYIYIYGDEVNRLD